LTNFYEKVDKYYLGESASANSVSETLRKFKTMTSAEKLANNQKLSDMLTDSQVYQLFDALTDVEKNTFKYMTKRYFAKATWQSNWSQQSRATVLKNISDRKYNFVDILKLGNLKEVVIQDKVGYLFDIMLFE